MALEIVLQAGEQIVFQGGVKGDRRPLVLGVTDQAVFVTKEQHFKSESWRLERIPIQMVTQVYIEKEKRLVTLALAFLVFTGGMVLTLGMAWNVYWQLPGTKVHVWPPIMMMLGIAILFVGRGRKVLIVQEGKKLHKYKPEMFAKRKDDVYELQDKFVEACRSVGINSPSRLL